MEATTKKITLPNHIIILTQKMHADLLNEQTSATLNDMDTSSHQIAWEM
jgi:hypothetical protein